MHDKLRRRRRPSQMSAVNWRRSVSVCKRNTWAGRARVTVSFEGCEALFRECARVTMKVASVV